MNRRKVNNLKTHLGNRNQTLRRGLEVSRSPGFGFRVEHCTFAARKEFIPGGCAGKLALTLYGECLAQGNQAANRVVCHVLQNRCGFCFGKSCLSRLRFVAELLGKLGQFLRLICRTFWFGGGFSKKCNALEHHQLFVDTNRDFHRGTVVPGFEVVAKGANLKAVVTLLV